MASSRVLAREVKMENTTRKPNWLELPRDVTLNMLQRLHTVEVITSACLVCPLWWNICKDPYMWRTIRMPEFYHAHYKCMDWMKMASNLRRLRIVYCDKLSDKGFIEVVKKFPLIDELDISNNYLSKHSFEAVGSCCPFLKTLTYDNDVSIYQNVEAIVIAKTMHGLRSLTISGWRLTSVRVVAILDGCSLLESLNLEYCYYMSSKSTSLSQSLKKRCSEQIKSFIPPILDGNYCYPCDYYFDDFNFD
ncbi:F-box protein SKIP19-like [Vicia villosa]|uniref:F-box protein SKIP19-like n=1 Tax=Vicia villosa TaxID=3911 RepID=UPI00273A79AD|nr:F-box protein SKIP19-like [Vicia villosa]